MSKKEKYTFEQKVKASEDYISGNASAVEIAKEFILHSQVPYYA